MRRGVLGIPRLAEEEFSFPETEANGETCGEALMGERSAMGGTYGRFLDGAASLGYHSKKKFK